MGGELRVGSEITSRRINNNDKKLGYKDNHEKLWEIGSNGRKDKNS